MTNKEFFEMVKVKNEDQVFFVKMKDEKNYHCYYNFNKTNLLGILEQIKYDILKQAENKESEKLGDEQN